MKTIRALISRCAIALLSTVPIAVGAASAQSYPNERITMVVGFSAGGFTDSVSRIIAEHIGKALGQPVTVENKPGAASNIAARAVASAKPDGYTILATTTAMAVNQTMYKNLNYSIKDLTAVAVPVSAPETIAVHPAHPAKTLAAFLDWAKGKKFNFATAGVGSGSHLAIAYFFKTRTKVDAVHVPFRGGAPAKQALLGQQVEAMAITLPGVSAQYKSDALRCLAVAGSGRTAIIPDCPTFAEAGFADFEAASWVGFFVPAKTDKAVVAKLNGAINGALKDGKVAKRLINLGNTPAQRSPAETAKFVAAEVARWGKMVKAVGVSVK